MSDNGEKEAMSLIGDSIRAKGCSELSYRITVPRETLDTKALGAAVGGWELSNGWCSIRRKAQEANYHIHVFWKEDNEDEDAPKAKLQVDVHVWDPEWMDKDQEPSADNFFPWVGQFFSVARLTAHMHAEFEFPSNRWQSKIMALPIEVPYAGHTAAIRGFAVNLHSEPEGVHDLWIEINNKKLRMELYADRLLDFKMFDLRNDVDAMLSVARSIIEEKAL